MKKRLWLVLALVIALICGAQASAISKLPNVSAPSLIDFGSEFLTVDEEEHGPTYNYYRLNGLDLAICSIIPEYLELLDSLPLFIVHGLEHTDRGWDVYTVDYIGSGVDSFQIDKESDGLSAQGAIVILCKIGTFDLYMSKDLVFKDTGARTCYVDDTVPEEYDEYYEFDDSESSGGHWETRTTTVKCSYCNGTGRCRICRGTGSRPSSINGHSMSCPRYCVFCSGTGRQVSSEQVYVYD